MVDKVSSRQELREDTLTNLGAPVIRIEITDDQLDQCIDYALKEFWKYHRDGSYESFYMYIMQPEDINNGYITIPGGIDAVVEVLPKGFSSGFMNFANVEWQLAAAALSPVTVGGIGFGTGASGQNPGGTVNGNQTYNSQGLYSMGMADWLMARQAIDTVKQMTGADRSWFTFNRLKHRLWPRFPINAYDTICLKVYQNVDPDNNPEDVDAWDDEWIKSFVQAQAYVTWGTNLSKYENVTLPGGVTINGQRLMDMGNQQMQQLLDQLRDEQPIDFRIA